MLSHIVNTSITSQDPSLQRVVSKQSTDTMSKHPEEFLVVFYSVSLLSVAKNIIMLSSNFALRA